MIRSYSWSGGTVRAVLTIDGECSVQWWMTGQIYDETEQRFLMHAVVIEPPTCYRCFACGLCGDFKRQMDTENTEENAAGNVLETCYGGEVPMQSGWNGDNAFAYDQYGISWEQQYRDENCPPIRGEFDTADSESDIEYICAPPPDFQYADECDPEIADLVIIEVQKARDQSTSCCDYIGGDFCGTEYPSFFMLRKCTDFFCGESLSVFVCKTSLLEDVE